MLIAHGALVYAATHLGQVVHRTGATPVTARFIVDANESERRWTPPPVRTIDIALDVPVPLAPAIEVPIEIPPAANRMVAREVASAPTPTRAQAAPKLISAVEYVREPIPRYPPQSRRLREQGLVVLRVLIDEKGQACSIEVESSSGHVRLDHAAKEAVAAAAFRPYVEDGEPRRAFVLIPIEFSLSGRA